MQRVKRIILLFATALIMSAMMVAGPASVAFADPFPGNSHNTNNKFNPGQKSKQCDPNDGKKNNPNCANQNE